MSVPQIKQKSAEIVNVEPQADPLLLLIERVACDPSADVGKMRELLDMHQALQGRQAEKAYGVAMSDAQKEMQPIATDCMNSQTKSKYASYAALDRVMRPIYTKHGFAPTFDTEQGAPEGYVRIVCDLMHSGGHKRRYQIDMPADGKGAKGGDVMTKTHATGSAASYGQRYLLKMMFNIAISDDDDGNAAAAKPSGALTDEQTAELIELADSVGADKAAFCRYWSKKCKVEITGLAQIPANYFERAKKALMKKGEAHA